MENTKKYMNPYLAGFILGLIILFSFWHTREGLGSSGAVKRAVAKIEQIVVPSHIENPNSYFHKYVKNGKEPLKNRLVFMVIGLLLGGFISGIINNRLKLKLEHSPKLTSKKRIIAAVLGGVMFGIGASFARGCASGGGLSAMAVFATSGFVLVAVMFGTGYLFAWFFRKLWL